jgi:branched-chain amino acid transport system permease protein
MTEIVQYAVQALSLGGLYALFALGVALVFGVGGIVNFAHGQLIVLAMYVVVATDGLPWPVTVFAAVLSATLLGVLIEAAVFRPARGADESTYLILSFALALGIQSLVLLFIGATAKSASFGQSLAQAVHIGGITIPAVNLVTLGVAGGFLAGLVYLMRHTRLGVRLRAAAEDFQMARLVGVRADGVMRATFALGGMLAGVAAVLLCASGGIVTPESGLQPVLIAFVATVIGGMGSLMGAAAGGLALGALTVVLQVTLPTDARPYRDAFLFAMVIALLVLRPSGLSGNVKRQERI